MAEISQERLKELLDYDPATGVFVRRTSLNRFKAGDVVGRVSKSGRHNGGGYRSIGIDGMEFLAHRLAWFYMTGAWPEDSLDHINGIRDDNRIENLRQATHSQNGMNAKRRSHNTSGIKGVSFHKAAAKWRADIQVDGKAMFLGLHDRKEAAASAYALAAYMYHGEFANIEPDTLSSPGDDVPPPHQCQARKDAECPMNIGTHLALNGGHPESMRNSLI